MQTPSTFQVYNASAGSGKTFTLVKEYLKILLKSEDIFRFQKILAITFTNKAAAEMKERVLKNLHDFADGKQNALLPIILEETAVDLPTIKERSTKILNAILHNYSAFSITTIDSFTHKIIKNFAYDLGLTLNFEVEMDAITLLSEAVDVLISKIGTDKNLTKVLIDFSLDKIDDDRSWDITKELNEFSKILLSEDDTKHFRRLAHKKLSDFTTFKVKLRQHQKVLEKRLREIGQEGLAVIDTMNLEHKDFYYALLPKHFVVLKRDPSSAKFFDQSKLRERIEENTFYSKSKPDDVKTAIEGILPELLRLYIESEQLYQQWVMNQLALKSIIPLAVLNNINAELSSIKEENNIRLNAEFNQLISDHIKDQPAPFIYERIGQRFMHYFIDEMQDTSRLQWKNLIPLIDNALAQEDSSLLLVGDGKQAIYRWRGGKAEQFIGLSADEENPFQLHKTLENLETNYRSYSEIIDFNNSFFKHTANFLQNNQYKKMFLAGNNQKDTTKKGGFVSVSFLEKLENKEEEQLKYPKKVLEKINDLQHDFLLNEICVLVRGKKEGVAIANYLSENGIAIVSSETLLLQNSAKVNFIVNTLQIIQHPNDEETRFEVLYFLYNHLQVKEDKHIFLAQFAKQATQTIFQQLKNYGVNFNVSEFNLLPFYEKIELLIRTFNLITSSDAYVQFFLDVIIEQQQKGSGIQEFLDFWSDKKHTLSIVVPESSEAVQIMTIHKSKGLEFPVVIFPCDVDVYRQIKPKVWLDELPENYNEFDELLVDFSSKLNYVNDRAGEIYQQQREALELDNFNLLYVALTRPVEQLHIITEKKLSAKGEENTNFYSGIFINYLKEINKWNDEVLHYSFGDSIRISKKEEKKSVTEIQHEFISTSWQQHNITMLANSSKLWDTERGKAIAYGDLIHEMMARITLAEDVEEVLYLYEKQGLILQDEIETIKRSLKEIVNHPQLKKYFSNAYHIYNERELLSNTNEIMIPDRLAFINNHVTIIDYKTGKPEKKHQHQLNSYANVLKQMNFIIEKKLLVYIDNEILIEEV